MLKLLAKESDRNEGSLLADGKYFDTLTIPKNQLIRLLRSKAVLLPGCEVVYRNEKDNIEQVWKYEGGLKEY